MLMPVQQNSFTDLRVLMVLTERGIWPSLTIVASLCIGVGWLVSQGSKHERAQLSKAQRRAMVSEAERGLLKVQQELQKVKGDLFWGGMDKKFAESGSRRTKFNEKLNNMTAHLRDQFVRCVWGYITLK